MRWSVVTDGSAISDETMRENGKARYPGGWAAVIEHGSDGYVIRGREANTTNVRMELRAVIEGLKAVPAGERVLLHFDCTVVYSVREFWARRELERMPMKKASRERADGDLWLELAEQFDRVDVELRMIGRGPNAVHRRAHGIAQAEAKALAAGLPAHATVLSRIEKKDRRRAAMAAVEEQARADQIRRRQQVSSFGRIGDALAARDLRHSPACEPGACVTSCPVWLNFGVRA